MLVLTDLILALLGKLAAMFAVEAVAARRIILRLDLNPEGLSLLIELLSLLVLPGSFVNSSRTVVVREGVAGVLNHLSGNS
jgi:uncharacterized membrane protein